MFDKGLEMPAGNEDPLSTEVSIAGELKDSALTVKAKSRAVSAFDRLLGSLIDIPGGWAEGVSRRIRLKDAITEKRIEREAANLPIPLVATDIRAHENLLAEQARRQENKDHVAFLAFKELKADPRENSEESEAANDTAEPENINEDWMNIFARHSEDASSEHLRILWAKVLAGEVRKPKSFSLSTLRFISELDQDIANVFQKVMKFRTHDGYIPKADMSGQELLDYHFLEEVGLIQEVGGNLSISLRVKDGETCIWRNGMMAIIFKSANVVNVPLMKITRAGREIASILDPEPDDVVLRKVAEIMRDQGVPMSLHKVASVDNGQFIYERAGEKLD